MDPPRKKRKKKNKKKKWIVFKEPNLVFERIVFEEQQKLRFLHLSEFLKITCTFSSIL